MKILGLLALIATLLIRPNSARAQPRAEDVYADVKEIIEDLMVKEVSESVIVQVACYSPKGLVRYYPRTLQMIWERNFGVVREVMLDEAIELLGNYTYVSLLEGRPVKLSDFLPASTEGCDDIEALRAELKELGGPERLFAQLQRREKWTCSTLPLDDCHGKPPKEHNPRQAFACNAATAAMHAARNNQSLVVEYVAKAAASLVYARVLASLGEAEAVAAAPTAFHLACQAPPKGTAPARRAAAGQAALALASRKSSLRARDRAALLASLEKAMREGASDLVTTSRGFVAELAQVDSAAVERLLGKTLLQILADEEAQPHARRIAAALSLLSARVEPKLVVEDRTGNLLSALESLDLGVVKGVEVAAHLYRTLKPPVAGKMGVVRVEIDPKTGLVSLKTAVGGTLQEPEFVGAALDYLEDLKYVAQLRKAFEAIVGGALPNNPELRQELLLGLLSRVKAAHALANDFVQRWRDATSSQAASDVAGMLRTLADYALDTCPPPKPQPPGAAPVLEPTLCDLVHQLGNLLDPNGSLRQLLKAAVAKDYRRLTVESLRAVFSPEMKERLCCDALDQSLCERRLDLHGRLLISLASYALSSRDQPDSAEAARAAFKSAAFDVIQDLGSRGGVDRKFWGTLVIPQPSLRASWNNSYLNSGDDGIRFPATLEWLTARARFGSGRLYFGAQLSLVDLLGPFSEIALRDSELTYLDQNRVFYNFLTPRVEGLVAWPHFSKNLAIGAGVSLRTAVPVSVSQQAARDLEPEGYDCLGSLPDGRTSTNCYVYSNWLDPAERALSEDFWPRVLRSTEFSLSIKYVP